MERTEPIRINPLEAVSFHPWTQNKINTENVQTLSDLRNSGTQKKEKESKEGKKVK